MKSVLVQLDDSTYRALTDLIPARSRQRASFIREAIRRAIREEEFARMRKAYLAQPDSEAEAEDWTNPEEFEA